jgi:hypothetical protein
MRSATKAMVTVSRDGEFCTARSEVNGRIFMTKARDRMAAIAMVTVSIVDAFGDVDFEIVDTSNGLSVAGVVFIGAWIVLFAALLFILSRIA